MATRRKEREIERKERDRDREKGATQIFCHHRKPPLTTRLSELLLVKFCFKFKNLGFLVFIWRINWVLIMI